MGASLNNFLTMYPIGKQWSDVELFSDVALIGDLQIKLTGISSKHQSGALITASAADTDGDPFPRAFFEFTERTAMLEASIDHSEVFNTFGFDGSTVGEISNKKLFPLENNPSLWKFSKSNGVATGKDWNHACSSALKEVLERHYILKSWYGDSIPFKTSASSDPLRNKLSDFYELEYYLFSPKDARICVFGLFCFPRQASHPLIYGFGADFDRSLAISSAKKECIQRLGFLWGESIPNALPDFSPTPDYHQELFLFPKSHDHIRGWLHGKHALRASSLSNNIDQEEFAFADITPQQLKGKLCVVKAISEKTLPLVFGKYPLYLENSFPEHLCCHPIA